jgi:hypothetical protein
VLITERVMVVVVMSRVSIAESGFQTDGTHWIYGKFRIIGQLENSKCIHA